MTRVIRQIYISTLVTGEFFMEFKSLAAAILLGIASVSSFAAGTTTSFDTDFDSLTGSKFTFSGAGTINAVFNFGGGLNISSISLSNATIDPSAWTYQAAHGTGSWTLASTSIGAGSHTFSFVTNGASISPSAGYAYGNYTVTPGQIAAPVPEPETYAMMLAGLGALGFLGRRRKTA
ncbi:MAG: FxDxF family PEP-CTERM protein [Leptothrix sp. (in: b-proteobacteria)]